jgi:hypothetical protein
MKAEEAERFYEEDEDTDEVFATFDAAAKGRRRPVANAQPLDGLRRFATRLPSRCGAWRTSSSRHT